MNDPVRMRVDHMDMNHNYSSLVDHVTLNGERTDDHWVEVHVKEGWGLKYSTDWKNRPKVEGVFEIFINPDLVMPCDLDLIGLEPVGSK